MSTTVIPSAVLDGYLDNLPPEFKHFAPRAVICNILPEPVMPIIQTYGVYHINYPKPGERCALTEIKWVALYMDKGDSAFNIATGRGAKGDLVQDNRLRSIQGAHEIAEDLCQQMNRSDSESGYWGKFVCAGSEPTEQELVEAERKLAEYFDRIVSIADGVWSETPRHNMIDGRCRKAAKYRGLSDKPWMSQVRPTTECPACRETIREGALICRHCHTQLDGNGGIFVAEAAEPETETPRRTRRKPAGEEQI